MTIPLLLLAEMLLHGGCPSIRLRREKQFFMSFLIFCECDLGAFTKYCEAHEDFFSSRRRRILGEPHDGALSGNWWRAHKGALVEISSPSKNWDQKIPSLNTVITA